MEDVLPLHSVDSDPGDALLEAERFDGLRRRLLEVLSAFEVDVLRLYAEGRSYQELGEHLDRHVKSVDNAVQRIKRKVELHLVERATADEHDDLALIA
jgi:RNA polymerase sporulation-specific sigma factor